MYLTFSLLPADSLQDEFTCVKNSEHCPATERRQQQQQQHCCSPEDEEGALDQGITETRSLMNYELSRVIENHQGGWQGGAQWGKAFSE